RKSFMKKFYGLLTIFIAFAMLLAACGNNSSNNANNQANNNNDGNGDGDEDIEIFSWWTGAGEEEGLLALIDLFEDENDLTIENAAVAGGAGTNAKAVLATRMQGDDPPSTFQVHGGAELNESWVAADKMESLDDLYEENDWMDKFPEDLIDLVSDDG